MASLTLVVIFQLVCMGNTNDCIAADPQNIVFYKDLFKGDEDTIKKIQNSLGLIFHDFKKPKEDGVIGPETTKALNEFCSHFEIKQTKNLALELAAALFYYAAIAETEPAWEKDTSEPNFVCWLSQLLDRQSTISRLKILNREAPQRLILLKYTKYEEQGDARRYKTGIDAWADTEKTESGKIDDSIVSYKLEKEDLEELETKNQILEQLQNLQDKEFSDKYELITALKTVFEEVTDQYRHYDEYLSLIVKSADKMKTDELNKASSNATDDGSGNDKTNNQKQPSNIERDRAGTIYKLSKQSFEKIEKVNIPKKIIAQIQRLEDIEYPNQELFWMALTALKNGKGATDSLKQFLEHVDELEGYKKTENFLKGHLAVDKLRKYQGAISKIARKEHFFDKSKPIEWSGGSCGCVLEDLSGVVYGFYPFWLVGDPPDMEKAGKQKGDDTENQNNQNEDAKSVKQELDFSVLSRIGYYAMSFDENGYVKGRLPWNPKEAEFLKTARDHRSAVDVVIYQSDWGKWSKLFEKGGGNKKFQNLIENIGELVKVELTDPFSKIKPIISFGGSSTPTMADGVILYFEGIQQAEKPKIDGDLFIAFIEELKKQLKAKQKDFRLSIMLSMDDLGNNIYDFDILRQIIPEKEKGEKGYEYQDYVDHFLVFLEEPTTDSKKRLRREIENNFTGYQRKTMLRKIIPVITPIAHDEKQLEQLKDDLIYFDDNFGGVGIWPLPITTGQESKDVATRVEEINIKLKEGKVQVWDFCKWICPKRWTFRIFWDASMVILVVFYLCYWRICKVRFISHSNRIFSGIFLLALLLLSLLIFILLLYCDPHRSFDFKDLVTDIGIIIYLVALLILWQLFVRKGKQP